MTYPADPNQPPQYQPDQSAWSQQGQPPNTGGFHPGAPPSNTGYYQGQPQPGYADPQTGYGAAVGPGSFGPGGPTPPKSGRSKGLIALIAALAVAVVGLGVGLILSMNRSGSAASSTITVTEPGTGGGGETVTVTAEGPGGGETVTETVTEPADGPAFPTGDAAPENVRAEGTIGEPLPRSFTDYEGVTTDIIITVHTAEWKDALEGDYVDPPVDTYLVLDVTLEAVQGTLDYSSFDFKIKDAEGREYDDSFAFGSDLNLLSGGTLAQGEKVRGALVFDLPRSESSLIYTMAYDDLGATFKIPA